MQQLEYVSPLLRSLEDLGAISTNYGIYQVKPFKDWKNTPWKDKVFSMRLCNAGEVLNIDKMSFNENPDTKIQQLKFELLIRSILYIDDRALITPEELKMYNETHNSAFCELDLLRIWIRNLEQIVLDRLDGVYGGLQLKQIRLLNGIKMCNVCSQEFSSPPNNSINLKYDLTEIICGNCVPLIDKSLFDIDEPEVVVQKKEPEKNLSTIVPSTIAAHTCNLCGKEFDIFEEYSSHIQTCQGSIEVHA
jgi:hypothetical protein